jgi:hypothetical protein
MVVGGNVKDGFVREYKVTRFFFVYVIIVV